MITYTTTHTKSGGRTDHQFYWNGTEVCRIYCNHCSQSAMMYFAGKSGPINYFMALEPGITAEHIDSAIRTPKDYAHYGYNEDILEGLRNGQC